MSKYKPLAERLARQPGDEWRATFAEIEAALGFALPKGARTGRAWWTATDKPHSRAWTGWEARDVDPADGAVTFRRAAPVAATQPTVRPPERVEAPGTAPVPGAVLAGGLAFAAALGALAVRRLLRRR